MQVPSAFGGGPGGGTLPSLQQIRWPTLTEPQSMWGLYSTNLAMEMVQRFSAIFRQVLPSSGSQSQLGLAGHQGGENVPTTVLTLVHSLAGGTRPSLQQNVWPSTGPLPAQLSWGFRDVKVDRETVQRLSAMCAHVCPLITVFQLVQ